MFVMGFSLLWLTVCFHAVMCVMGLLCCGTLCAFMLSCFSWGYFVVAHCVLSCCRVSHGVTLLWLTVSFHAVMPVMGLLFDDTNM